MQVHLPNRDGAKGIGGCTFCNNSSFNPNGPKQKTLEAQFDSGRRDCEATRAKKFLAYFQAYTNTYAEVKELDALYRQAMTQHDIVGLSVGSARLRVGRSARPARRVPRRGYIVWLELGLQSAFDESLRRSTAATPAGIPRRGN